MVVLATRTKENERIATAENGVLIEDSPDAVYAGLRMIYERRDRYDLKAIQEHMQRYEWSRIVDVHLRPYLDEIHDGRR